MKGYATLSWWSPAVEDAHSSTSPPLFISVTKVQRYLEGNSYPHPPLFRGRRPPREQVAEQVGGEIQVAAALPPWIMHRLLVGHAGDVVVRVRTARRALVALCPAPAAE